MKNKKKSESGTKNGTKAKVSRRGKSAYPALDPKLNLRNRQKLIDYDYLDKLSPKEKEWLNKFTDEYTNASFSQNDRKNLIKGKAEKKESYTRNNARNRDIQNLIEMFPNLGDVSIGAYEDLATVDEDDIIALIDYLSSLDQVPKKCES